MNNFGVVEIAGQKKTSAPGWAYVPDTTVISSANLQPANRKRARNAPGLTLGDLTARQETKRRKEVEALDKDGGRDNTIPVPVKSGRAQNKHTPNVRKILQSQKTFGNHLDDFLALQALTENNAAATGSRSAASNTNNSKRPAPGKKDASSSSSTTTKAIAQDHDTQMADADLPPVLPTPYKPPPKAHPGDNDPLLASRVPDMPSDDELRKLLAHPPLTYGEAEGTWEQTYPVRIFCEVCGYWGRVRCMKCGSRVCALDCLEAHKEECITRYGI